MTFYSACLLSFVVTLVLANVTDLMTVTSPTTYTTNRHSFYHGKRSRPCGEGLCKCANRDRTAKCLKLKGNVTRFPSLPDRVKVLIVSFGKSFTNLTDMQFFAHAQNITELRLRSSYLKHFDARTFFQFKKLAKLQFNYRFIGIDRTFEDIKPFFFISSLKHLDASVTPLMSFPPNAFADVKNSHLQTLNLSLSGFVNMKADANLDTFKPLRQLRVLDISLSRIKYIDIDRVLRLTHLYLDGNEIKLLPETCRGKKSMLPWLKHLSMRDNDLGFYLSDYMCLPELRILDLSGNPLKVIPACYFIPSKYEGLSELYLDGVVKTPRTFLVLEHAFNNSNLKLLSFTGNDLRFATQVHPEAFDSLPNLETLRLDDNDFSVANDQLFFSAMFFSLKNLKHLSMSRCHFNSFTAHTFEVFPQLISLDLKENAIATFPNGIFYPLSSLQMLDVSQNKLSVIKEGVLSQETHTHLSTMHLQGNPLECTCDTLWLSKWVAARPAVFGVSNASLTCSNRPGVDVQQYIAYQPSCLLSREMSMQIIISCSLTLVALLSVSLAFRYRWHLRLLLHEAFRGAGRSRRLEAGRFDFDVFVSYASEDLPWIRQQLIPQLEEGQGLRLCLHERDFIPGKNIVDNIADCVQASKKTLMVYSRHFASSPWCQFELTYCLIHAMDLEDDLLVVCLDDMASREMTTAMLAVLKTTTFIQWMELDAAVQSFWRRIRLSLVDVIQSVHRV